MSSPRASRLRGAAGIAGAAPALLLMLLFTPQRLLAQQAPGPQQASLQPFQASYLWFWHGTEIALSRVSLTHRPDDLWSYDSSSRPRGLGVFYPQRPQLHSLMRIDKNGVVRPLQYNASGSGRQHDANVTFDWDHAHATGLYEGTDIDLAITPGVQDDLSVQIAMLVQLIAGKTPDEFTEIDKQAVREYDYSREGEEQLDTAVGRIDTVIYASHHPGSPRTTRFWCAPSLGYIPLQVQQRVRNSVEWTMKIRSLGHAP